MAGEDTIIESNDENIEQIAPISDTEDTRNNSASLGSSNISENPQNRTTQNEVLETVNNLVANTRTREALEFLLSKGFGVQILKGEFEKQEKDYHNGTVNRDDYQRRINKINQSILEFAKNGSPSDFQVERLPDFEALHELFLDRTHYSQSLNIKAIDEQKFEQILKKRVLFIRCQDSAILFSAHRAIVNWHQRLNNNQVDFFRPSVDIAQLAEGQRMEIEYYEKIIQKRATSSIVVIDNPPIYFLNGFEKTYNRAEQITRHLEEKNIALICLLPASKYEKEEFDKLYRSIKKEAKSIFEYWEISFVQPYLASHFEIDVVEELLRQIKELNIAEDDLYIDIQGTLIEDYPDHQSYFDALKQKILNRVSIEKKELERLKEQFEKGDYLQRALLFIGAFFPGIMWKEFELLVKFYLQKAPPIQKENEKEGETIISEPSWIEKWNGKSAELMRSCLLRTVSKDEGRVVEFVQQSYGLHFKEFLLEDYYPFIEPWLNQAGNSGFLFGNFSERMLRSNIQLIVTATRNDPTTYDEFWLRNIVVNIKENFDGIDTSNLSSDNPISQLIELYHQFSIKQQYKQLFFARLTDLIKELLTEKETPLLQGIVEKFIKILIDSSDAKADALDIVLRLYRHLKGTPNFNEDFVLNNIKRLINEANTEQKWRTYNILFQILEMDELFDKMEIWRNGDKQTDFSPLEEYAWRFYYDYCLAKLSEIDESEYGQTPPPLFSELNNDKQLDATSRTAILFDRLFDKRAEQTMSKFLIRQSEFLPYTVHIPDSLIITIGDERATISDWVKLLGNLIEDWTWIIYGFQAKKALPKSENDVYIDALFKQIFIRTSKEQAKGIFEWWQQKPNSVYNQKVLEVTTSNLKPKEKEQEKNRYILRREHLRRMRERALKIKNSIHLS